MMNVCVCVFTGAVFGSAVGAEVNSSSYHISCDGESKYTQSV